MAFPTGYQGDMNATWTGFFMKNFEVYLPKSFRKDAKDSKEGDPETDNTTTESEKITCFQSVGGRAILIDRTGFTGSAFYDNTCVGDYSAKKWKWTLTGLELNFLQNQFISGSFKGGIHTPMQDEANPSGYINYKGMIEKDPSNDASLKVSLNADIVADVPITIKALRSRGKLIAGSWIKFEYEVDDVKGDRFYPSGNFSGEFSPATKVKGTKTQIEATPIDSEGSAQFVGLRFLNLAFQTKQKPYVTIQDFEYQKDLNDETSGSKLGNFPVSITRLAKVNEAMWNGDVPTPDDLWIDFAFKLALAKDKIGGSSRMVIKTAYESGRLRFQGISLQSLDVHADISGLSIDGDVTFCENDEVKSFGGSLTIEIPSVFEKPIKAKINAFFGYNKIDKYRFGYIDGYLGGLNPGIVTGIGDLTVVGAGMGVYFNMEPKMHGLVPPKTNDCSVFAVDGLMSYIENRNIPFGFKVMVGISNVSQSFTAKVSLDFALDRNFGINSISLWGSGEIAADFGILKNEVADARDMIGNSVSEISGNTDLLQNIKPAENQTSLLANAERAAGTKNFGPVSFNVGFMLNIPEKLLHAEAEVYVNYKQTIPGEEDFHFRGVGQRGRAVRAVFHWKGTSEFYIRVGTPYDRAGLEVLYGERKPNKDYLYARADAYLMMGTGVPEFPLPPNEVLKALPGLEAKINAKNTVSNKQDIRKGLAIALGASVSVDAQVVLGLAKVKAQAVAGFDLLLAHNPGGSGCNNSTDAKPYGQMQIYGMARASVVNKKTSEELFDAGIAFYLYGNGIKPLGGIASVCVLGSSWEKRVDKGKKPGKLCGTISGGEVCFN